MSLRTVAHASALAVAALFAASAAQARVYDHLFRGGFERVTDAPATDAEAARFLTQATFGPNDADIAQVRKVGISQWIDQQLSTPTTNARPFMEAVNTAMNAANPNQFVGHGQRLDRWFHTAVVAPDQLRQRMAYALSQIFVISDQNGTLAGEPIQVTEYWDMLARGAFTTYRDLLNQVTYHPSMGKFLSHFRNRKSGPGREPDENYAREVMQLFSVGLIELNLDFSPLLDGSNQPQPTYDQTTITNYAKVFTGFAYNNATNINNGTNSYLPMRCFDNEHDQSAKVVLGDTPMPANQTCDADVQQGLNIIASHPNVAPFISRQLIQRFTTSNPSPQYIQRVATKFVNNGFGERGDLGAVIKAILTDTEARSAPTQNFGKLREPLLRLTALLRAFPVQFPAPTAYGEIKMGLPNLMTTYGQRPLGANTVFNFYEPDYQQPGPIENAGMYSPEFQIINETSTYTISNSLYDFASRYYVGMTNPPTDRPLLDVSAITGLAGTPAALVDEVNRRMMYGSMSASMRTTLINMVSFMNGATASEKARSVLHITVISPEFAAQR